MAVDRPGFSNSGGGCRPVRAVKRSPVAVRLPWRLRIAAIIGSGWCEARRRTSSMVSSSVRIGATRRFCHTTSSSVIVPVFQRATSWTLVGSLCTLMVTSSMRLCSSSLRSRSVVVGAAQTGVNRRPARGSFPAGQQSAWRAPRRRADQLGLGASQFLEPVFPLGLQGAGHQTVLGFHRAVAAFGPLASYRAARPAGATVRARPDLASSIRLRLHGGLHARRCDRFEEGRADRSVNARPAPPRMHRPPRPSTSVPAGAVVTGSGVSTLVVDLQLAAATPKLAMPCSSAAPSRTPAADSRAGRGVLARRAWFISNVFQSMKPG